MKSTATKPLSRTQIDATIQRLRQTYTPLFEAAQKAKAKKVNAMRKRDLERVCQPLPLKVRKAVIVAIGSSKIPGVTNYDHGYRGWHCDDRLAVAFADLEYALVMADNTSFQHHIDKFEQLVCKLLK